MSVYVYSSAIIAMITKWPIIMPPLFPSQLQEPRAITMSSEDRALEDLLYGGHHGDEVEGAELGRSQGWEEESAVAATVSHRLMCWVNKFISNRIIKLFQHGIPMIH